MNPLEILGAYSNMADPTPEELAISKERLDICSTCPFKTNMLSVDICSKCFCPLTPKSFSPINSCPAKKWIR